MRACRLADRNRAPPLVKREEQHKENGTYSHGVSLVAFSLHPPSSLAAALDSDLYNEVSLLYEPATSLPVSHHW